MRNLIEYPITDQEIVCCLVELAVSLEKEGGVGDMRALLVQTAADMIASRGTPFPKATKSLAQALQAATPLFVSTGGHPKIDTSKPYVLLSEERRDEIVKALSRRAD